MDKNQLNKIKNIVEAKNMKKMMFTMEGNLCAARIREGRYRHNPPLTQEDLARKIQFLGNENMTSLIISRIEKNQRHVCDGELWQIATPLGVTMEWLVGKEEESVE